MSEQTNEQTSEGMNKQRNKLMNKQTNASQLKKPRDGNIHI